MEQTGCGADATVEVRCYTGPSGPLAGPGRRVGVTAVLPGWNPEMERRFKELLYRFLEEVHSTKAALYLLAEDGRYLLVTQYGFGRRDLLAAEFPPRAAMVQLARHLRTRPKAFNSPGEAREIAEYLEGAGTARILLVPLYTGSRLVGFADVRDKGRRKVFTPADEEAATAIASALVALVRSSGLYPDLEESGTQETVHQERPGTSRIRDARLLDRGALPFLLGTVERLAALPGVGAVAVTLAADGQAHTVVRSVARPGADALNTLRRHQASLLAGAPDPASERTWTVDAAVVEGAGDTPREMAASRPLLTEDGWGLAGTVLGGLGSPVPETVLEILAREVEMLREARTAIRQSRRLAKALLEPGEQRFPELRHHSEAVSRLAWRLAAALGEDDRTIETAALAGWLHDVGMRELDYERLYRHPQPGPTERRLYARHPVIGERILSEAGLPVVAEAVRHHHERWDGGGYPDRLRGDAIPKLARIVHVAEVYDVLTSDGSYRRPVGRTEALGVLRSAAGHQFDPEVVRALGNVV